MKYNKKGQQGGGQIAALVAGIIGLIFLIVVGFVSVNVLTDADLVTDTTMNASVTQMVANLTSGVGKISAKVPTLFTIAVAVLLLGLIVFLVMRARQAQSAQGGSI